MKKAAKATKPVIGDMIDTLYKHDALVEKATQVLEKVAAERDAIEEQVLAELERLKTPSAGGKAGGVERAESDVPTAKDWSLIHAYIAKNHAFDLLEKRIALKAWRERLEAGEKVPGVEVFRRVKLRRVKLKPKVSVSKAAR